MGLFTRDKKTEIDPNAIVFGTDSISPKTVKVRKITIGQWRGLFSTIETLPQMVLAVLTAKPEERAAYVMAALDHALDEIVEVVAVLTGIEAEWIADNTAPDELMAYFVKAAQVNNFGALLKNAQSVLSLASNPEQGAD